MTSDILSKNQLTNCISVKLAEAQERRVLKSMSMASITQISFDAEAHEYQSLDISTLNNRLPHIFLD